MRLKKILVGILSTLMLIACASPMAASAGVGGGPVAWSTWDVLVLVLPDASIGNGPSKNITTMHYGEIEKVKQMAKDIEGWSTGQVRINVDVKVDYDDIQSQSFGQAMGYTLEAGNIKGQIDRNVTDGKYDSVLVVYRAKDGQTNSNIVNTAVYRPRSLESNGASYATLPLKDEDHKMAQFDKYMPEQDLVTALLESVYIDLKPNHQELNYVPRWSDAKYNVAMLKTYMMISDQGNVAGLWREFSDK